MQLIYTTTLQEYLLFNSLTLVQHHSCVQNGIIFYLRHCFGCIPDDVPWRTEQCGNFWCDTKL